MKTNKRLQKNFSVFVCVALIMVNIPLNVLAGNEANSEFAGGNGTEESPYLIATTNQLNNVRNHLDSCFKLIRDIEFVESDFEKSGAFYNDGRGWNPIESFSGVFDGDGYTIKGLHIQGREEIDEIFNRKMSAKIGLFGDVDDSVIKNVGLVEVDIEFVFSNTSKSDGYAPDDCYAGALVGYMSDGLIDNCYSTGSLSILIVANQPSSSSKSHCYVGGIIGKAEGGNIIHCYNEANVSGKAETLDDPNYRGFTCHYPTSYVGGIVGESKANISECYNAGEILAVSEIPQTSPKDTTYNMYAYAGGLAGRGYKCDIENCYNIGDVEAYVEFRGPYWAAIPDEMEAYAGGLVGIEREISIVNCYNTGKSSASIENHGFGGRKHIYAGPFEGRALSNWKNCYYFDSMRPAHNGGCSIEEMKSQETFVGFDFDSTWTMGGNAEYPYPELQRCELSYDKKLENISISSEPTKEKYIEGKENLDTAGGKIRLHYSKNVTDEIDMTNEMVSGFDNTEVGYQYLTVTYEGFTKTFGIWITKKELSHITLKSMPVKQEYLENTESLDVTGGVISLHYNNDTSEDIALLPEYVDGFDNTKIGEQMLTVTYRGKVTYFVINIKALQPAPIAPVVMSYTDSSITLMPIDGCEYSKDGVNWQSSNIFTGLSPATQYTLYQRMAKTSSEVAGKISEPTRVTTDKSKQMLTPDAPTVQRVTSSSITLVAVDGCEYSKNGTTWQTSNVFSGLSCGTVYTFYQRYKETTTTYAGKSSEALKAKTDKGTQTAPSAPRLSSKTHNSVTLVAYSGYEYSSDGIHWQTSNVFTGLNPETNYIFYQRKAETDQYYASASSTALTVKTNEQPAYIPGDVNGDGKVNSLDGLILLRYLNGWDIVIAVPEALDINGDGKVNSLDGLMLMRYLNGWDITLG